MAGMTDYLAEIVLEYLTGKTPTPLFDNVWLGLFTTPPISNAGMTGGVEATGAGYARCPTAAADWNNAQPSSGSEPSVVPAYITNARTITFNPAGVGGWGNVLAIGIFDAPTGGNLLTWDYLGAYAWMPFSCSLGSPGILTSPSHGLLNGDPVVVSTKLGGALPATAGSWAGVKTVAGATADAFNVGVNTTSTGDGMVRKIYSLNVPVNSGPAFPAGQLLIALS